MLNMAQVKYPYEDAVFQFQRAAVAYLLAVTAAAAMYTLLLAASEMLSTIANGGVAPASPYLHHSRAIYFSLMKLITFIAGWVYVFFTALLPFMAGLMVARQFRVGHWSYFAGGGAMTAAVLCALYITIPNVGLNRHEPWLSFPQLYFSELANFMLSGLTAGLVCWLYLYRTAYKEIQLQRTENFHR
jgi:hypothetical protein